MNAKYKIGYLNDGTKVKVTNQLFNQIKKWEESGIEISYEFLDELKIQDNNWINKTRQYYRNAVAIQTLSYHVLSEDKSLRTKNFQNKSNNRILLNCVMKNLSECTTIQKRRFLLYYYYGFSYKEIADIENRNIYSIKKSVQKAVKILINYEHFRK